MERKAFHCEVKAEGDEGEFVALASVFNNVDLVGDKVLPGAFAQTLKRYRDAGDPIPIVFDHQHDNIEAYIGKADPLDVNETEVGLEVRGKLDVEDNSVAKAAHKLMKDRVLKAWSFAYTVPEGGQKRTKDANEISEVDLIEVGPTLKGANPEAQLQGVKSLAEADVVPATDVIPANRVVGDGVFPPGTMFKASDDGVTLTRLDSKDNVSQAVEVEDRPDEEPSEAKSRRQDPPNNKNDWSTEDWFMSVFGPK